MALKALFMNRNLSCCGKLSAKIPKVKSQILIIILGVITQKTETVRHLNLIKAAEKSNQESIRLPILK